MTTFAEPVKLADVLTHLRKHYSDFAIAIANDLECAVAVLDGAGDQAVVRQYARLRRSAPRWKPRDPRSNNHGSIHADNLRMVGARVGRPSRAMPADCEGCRRSFMRARVSTKFCSTRCRVRGHRVTRATAKQGSVDNSATTPGSPKTCIAIAVDSDGLRVTGAADTAGQA